MNSLKENTPESVKIATSGSNTPMSSLGMSLSKKRLSEFNSKYSKDGSCWLWNGTKHYSGYGHFKILNKVYRAHRIMWNLTFGDIPNGKYVLHSCDIRNCVNPCHLFLGDAKTNLDDCISKGRFRVASGDKHGTKTHPEKIAKGHRHGSKTHPESFLRGESVKRSKLNNQKVLEIKRKYIPGKYGTGRLAKEYGVSQRAIYALVSGQTWKHVTS